MNYSNDKALLWANAFYDKTDPYDALFLLELRNGDLANLMNIFNMRSATWNAEILAINYYAPGLISWDIVRYMTTDGVHFRYRHKANGVDAASFDKLVGAMFEFTPKLFSLARFPRAAILRLTDAGNVALSCPPNQDPDQPQPYQLRGLQNAVAC